MKAIMNTVNKLGTKSDEIDLLFNLAKGDSYFSDAFSSDISVMCENIRNDFPLMLNTSYMKVSEHEKILSDRDDMIQTLTDMDIRHREESTKTIEVLEDKLTTLVDCILPGLEEESPVYKFIYYNFPINFIIRRKIGLDLALTDEEKEVLYNIL